MGLISSATSLSEDYYLGMYYRDNRNAKKASGRKELSTTEVVYEDARALRRAIKKLNSYSYSSETENLESIKSSISAFATTYNNAISSNNKEGSSTTKRYARQLKALAEKHSDELEKCGITVKKDGQLEVNKNLLNAASIDTLKSVFSNEETDILSTTSRVSKRMKSTAFDTLYAQMTGNGTRISITL